MRFERRLKPMNTVDLTPLIDVVFQLVIFFMVSSVFKTAPGIPLELPESSSSEAVQVSELRIKALANGQIFVNYQSTSLEELDQELLRFLKDHDAAKTEVLLEGSQDLPYQSLIKVLDILRQRGLTKTSLITLPKEASP